MKKGKFEAGRNTAKPAARAAAPTARAAAAPATRAPAKKKKKSGVKAWPIIAAVAGLAVVISGVLFYNSYKDDGLIYPNVYAGGVNIGGMTQEEALQAISPISRQYQENDMVLTVAPAQPTGDAEKDETFTLTIPPEKSHVQVDLESAVKAAYDYGREGSIFDKAKAKAEAENTEYRIDATDFLTVDEACLRQAADAMIERGCIKAYTLDGGQTATMIFNGTTFNRVDWDSERTMSDIVYFATAKDSGEGATP